MMNTFLSALMLTLILAPGDPPTATVSGDLITINADFAWYEAAGVMTMPAGAVLVQGTPMVGSSLSASYDGKQPIVWRVPPGTYAINAYGYPVDRMNPVRAQAMLTVTVSAPGRQQQINSALLEFAQRSYQIELAKATIATLKPTPAELKTALIGTPTP